MNAAENSCATRNVRSTERGSERHSDHDSAIVSMNDIAIPMSGDSTIKSSGFTQPEAMIAAKPAFATAAPAYPPIRACDEEEGNPAYQVMRFHAIAPMSPASTTIASTTASSTSPEPIVLATAVPNTKNATKLNTPDHMTAAVGDSTRVETTVAIELAASWKPLMKSNESATTTMPMTNQTELTISRA